MSTDIQNGTTTYSLFLVLSGTHSERQRFLTALDRAVSDIYNGDAETADLVAFGSGGPSFDALRKVTEGIDRIIAGVEEGRLGGVNDPRALIDELCDVGNVASDEVAREDALADYRGEVPG